MNISTLVAGISILYYDGDGQIDWGPTLLANGAIIAGLAILAAIARAVTASRAAKEWAADALDDGDDTDDRATTTKSKHAGSKDDEDDDAKPGLRSSVRSPSKDADDAEADRPKRTITKLAAPKASRSTAPGAPGLRISLGPRKGAPPAASVSRPAGSASLRTNCPRCTTVLADDLSCPVCGYQG